MNIHLKSKRLIWTHTFGVGTLISDCMNKDCETVLICCISYRVSTKKHNTITQD